MGFAQNHEKDNKILKPKSKINIYLKKIKNCARGPELTRITWIYKSLKKMVSCFYR